MTEKPSLPKTKACIECGREKRVKQVLKSGRCMDCTALERRAKLEAQAEARRLEKLTSAERKRQDAAERAKRRAYRKQREQAEKEKAKEAARAERRAKRAVKNESQRANAAKRELASRVLSRRHLLPFVIRSMPSYEAGWVHKDIARRLEKFSRDVEAGRSPRLMIQMPPRHGKSELASKFFPAWHLGRCPHHEIIAASYAASLANGFSRKVRGLLRDDAYKVVFDKTRLDPEAQNTEGWLTTKGGGYTPAGVGGPITGKGAHILVIDDPIKNAEEADSEASREGIKEWYQTTAYTRLAPGGGVLVIQTRWHDDDLSGWLERMMAEDEGDRWEIVRYPAIAEQDEKYRRKGEALHPERYPIESLKRIRKAVGPRTWQALYQQNPVADDGEYFTRQMFQWYDGAPPANLQTYSAWDLAIGKGERNDFTVGITVGIDQDDNMWVLDMVRGRFDAFEIAENVIANYRRWRPAATGIEKGQIQMAMGPYLEQRMQEERLWEMYVKDLATGRRDKPARARAIQGRMRQGKVFFPKNASWMDVLSAEMLRFPDGVHDDCVDALAWIGLMLQEMDGLPEAPPPKRDTWRNRLNELIGRPRGKTWMSA